MALIVYGMAMAIVLMLMFAWAALWVAWQAVQLVVFLPLFFWHRHQVKKELADPAEPAIKAPRSPFCVWLRRVWLD